MYMGERAMGMALTRPAENTWQGLEVCIRAIEVARMTTFPSRAAHMPSVEAKHVLL